MNSKAAGGDLFGDIARERLNVRMSCKTEKHLKNLGVRLNEYILPKLAGRPIKEIKTPEILYIFREIEKRGFWRPQHASRISSVRFLDLRLPQGTVRLACRSFSTCEVQTHGRNV
ncbi:MAG: hypothetical protein IJ576_01405 [Synergistaceae bacterium]|nr:hypothetical protein [Synergistaceae bacterium]MBR1417603.1 hypothetical protein [Synergistaceae bacterium]